MTASKHLQEEWTEVIQPRANIFQINLGEIHRYKDLLILFIKRDLIANYKQTILGPLWFFIQPLLTTLIFVLVFGKIAGISTDGVPMLLFYLAGITLWNYFADCLNKTATVFKDNAPIFGKVYFPRLIMPLSIICGNLIRLSIQFLLFLIFWLYYLVQPAAPIHPNIYILLVPLLIMALAGMALGFGLIISSLTNKYKDLIFLMTFLVQLAMYATPVIYPLSTISSNYKWLIRLNPLTSVIETFRYAFLGSGAVSWGGLLYTFICTIFTIFAGIIIFNKVEKSFIDTI